ncbi:hypothetical protein CERSUDRAFT_99004 [Gelatoporia subvermispora B]|uniref:Cytochrome P450 n=1 Tax=Ceriporiopsis subvermispora (strain B) TaxID=914234 RepID=M2QLI6_CERS8|nr:hypothetical protein CERSUDRAFT_99004 [Gelatoporia subvermispora B]
MDPIVLIFLSALALVCLVYKRRNARNALADIPGPEPQSFLLGNLPELFQEQVGQCDVEWLKRFGGVARVKAPFGDDMLWISDAKALQYIYQTSGYNFPKQPERRAISRLLADHGLTWADGDIHRRQRKAMLPAFGTPEAKALVPVFRDCAARLTVKWKEIISVSSGDSTVFNIPMWVSRATMDAIGEAAFDYKFGILGNSDNELAKAYQNLLSDIFAAPSGVKIFLQSIAHYVPLSVQEFFYDILPGKGLDKARFNRTAAHKVAYELLEAKTQALSVEKSGRDIMSILVKANSTENEKARLSEDEMIAQMRTIMLAGQETTSNGLTWTLLELAKYPEIQRRLREEIWNKEAELRERGNSGFTAADLESMPYLQAVLRESLRFNPPVYHTFRQSAMDDVLPLSKPITTLSGKVVQELPIPKGTRAVLSIIGHGRDKDVWGEDADQFNPERWLGRKASRGPNVGVFSNLLTFAGGVRACIGWRFAIYELQSFLVELVSHFEFELTDDAKRVRREASIVMVPTLDGETEKGSQLPMKVSLAVRP